MSATRRRWIGVFTVALALLFLAIVAGPWALTKWAESHFSRSLGEPVTLERLYFNPFTATASFSSLEIGSGKTPMLTAASGRVAFAWDSLWQPGIHIESVTLGSPHLNLVSPPSGPLNVTALGQGSSASNDAGQPMPLTIDRIRAEHGRIVWVDQAAAGQPRIQVDEVDLTLEDFQRADGGPMQGQATAIVGGGQLDLEGQFGVLPLSGDLALKAQQVNAAALDPWLTRALPARVVGGQFSLDGRLRFGQASRAAVAYQGRVTLNGVETQGAQGQPLFSVQRGVAEQIDFASGDHLVIGSLSLTAPKLNALVDDQGRFNLLAQFGGSQQAQAGQAQNERSEAQSSQGQTGQNPSIGYQSQGSGDDSQSGGMALALDKLRVEQGEMTFEDRRMSPVVSLDIGRLQGQLTRFDTCTAKPAKYHVEGRVSDGTPVMIEGEVSFGDSLGARMHLTTQRLALSQFAPYIRRFAGYRIEHGSADLDLHYRLQDGALTARNHIILKQLDLGREVDPDASSLPLKNLVALLQAESGVINLNIPIDTTVSGSNVDMSVVIWQAISESLENLVTSPIDSLQALVGSPEEESP
ncbi:DUF748 domain-containing protein [Salinicola sp. DM10]|uniref:DUF748 domain-containing protein n=1 Tax=Salinicola sp. DM10 TaxID=2815721 RepID=UPI001A8FF287|nr:DUF748 domain-containing protein [Salinicola sp. DM10]MCE3026464.1 DUF748 domain-containing protein [Salinicola sp. DM10]